MPRRLNITKTYKLFIDGRFPRTESGRSLKIEDSRGGVIAHVCHGSCKDVRDAVEAAAKAQSAWADATAYNRGQILYRMAEMMQGKRDEFAEAINATSRRRNVKAPKDKRFAATRSGAIREVDAAVDRLVCFAGWTDKFASVLGGQNPVAGPHENFTVPEPTGVIGVIGPDQPALLGLISLIAPPLCAGNTIIALGSETNPIPAAILGEVCATADVPAGVVNIITGRRAELLETFANHREIGGIHAANLSRAESTTVKLGVAENLKRVAVRKFRDDDWFDPGVCDSPWMIESFLEMKTIWHPSST